MLIGRKAIMKKTASMVLALALILSLCACNRGTVPEEDDFDAAELAENMSWDTQTYYPFDPGYAVNGVARVGSTLMFISDKIAALADYEELEDRSISISDARQLTVELPEKQTIRAVCAGGDDNFYILAGENPKFSVDEYSRLVENKDYNGEYTVLKYSPEGNMLGSLEISDWHGGSVSGIAVTKEGAMVIYGSGYYTLLDFDGKVINTQETSEGDALYSVSICNEGIIASYLMSGYCLIDSGDGSLEGITLFSWETLAETTMNWCATQGLDGEYIVNDGNYFKSLNFETLEVDEFCRWNYSQYNADCTNVCRLSQNAFAYTTLGGLGVTIGTNTERPYKEKSVVKVAMYDCDASASLDILNKESQEYVYQYEKYSDSDFNRLIAELSTADAPDLILFEDSSAIQNLDTTSELFEDLYPYLDADSALSRDSFIPNLLDALEVNGRLTELWSYVMVYSMVARTQDVGQATALSPDDYDEIWAKDRKYPQVFPVHETRESVWSFMSAVAVNEFVSKDTAASSFDNEAFARLLEWCSKIEGDTELMSSESMLNALLIPYSVTFPFALQNLYEAIGEYRFVGYPVPEGTGCYYSSVDVKMAIPTLGSNKSGAWEYIASQLSLETQLQEGRDVLYICVNYEALQRIAASQLDGSSLDLFYSLLEDTTTVANYADEPLRQILISCADAYFAGAKSLEDTVAEIQSRASIYMSEKYG